MIEAVVREGPMLEAMMMNKEIDNQQFRYYLSHCVVFFIWLMIFVVGFCSKTEVQHTSTIDGSSFPFCKAKLTINGAQKTSACLEVYENEFESDESVIFNCSYFRWIYLETSVDESVFRGHARRIIFFRRRGRREPPAFIKQIVLSIFLNFPFVHLLHTNCVSLVRRSASSWCYGS